ncbi:MAG: helical backbone metal receptor [Bryobacteraceae bacterium]|nr:helical backbone metal receptor [Bryobacteraceae bacterium]MDW8377655.1 helical backbone metal receptor [Bryobacterales bacterium]
MKQLLAFVLLLAGWPAWAQPARIVSTSPSITEILFALGAGPHVVGVSNYCRYPPEVRHLPKVGSYLRPSAERIAQLRPDLVIMHHTQQDTLNRLQALGIRTQLVEQGSLANLFDTIRTLGRAVGRESQAASLAANIQAKIRPPAPSLKPNPRVLIVVARNPGQLTGLVAAGPGAYLSELVEAAGGSNALTQSSTVLYPKLSLETVIHLNPDYIVDASATMDASEDTPEKRSEFLAPWMARQELSAVRNRRVVATFSEAMVVPGPRVTEALEILKAVLSDWGKRP